ncbi:MAG: sulfatase [Candidatus Sumerlaeota bacterium]
MKPNILLILIDDMGWRDICCYGSEFYETPNIDRLAKEGMLFTDAYAACPVCSPTRASIMSGKYPARVGVTNFIAGKGHPSKGLLIDAPYIKQLPSEEVSVAQALKEGGYHTWHVGKWHLGEEPYYPEKHGFDVNIGGCSWGMPSCGYFSPWNIPNMENGPEGKYLTDHLTDEVLKLIENNDDKPFFLNLWYYQVHIPIQGKPELVEKYEKKAKDLGLDKLPTFEEGERFPAQHRRDQNIKRRLLQSDPAYAAMIESLDTNIGRVLEALEKKGQLDNTVIVFTSDNGGLSTAEGSPTCNAPLSEGKGWMYEGGTREPMLVRWPQVVEAGSTCNEPITSPDIYPTFLEIAGLEPRPEQHVDGKSFLPLLKQEEGFDRGPIFWHYPHYGNQGGTPGSSIRWGDYKLIEFYEDGRLELYNLREDIGEKNNLAAIEPETTKRLHDRLVQWRNEVEALYPEPNPDWKE